MKVAAFVALQNIRGPSIERERTNPLEYLNETLLVAEYRVNRVAFEEVCDLVREDLQRKLNSAKCLTVEEQVLVCLKLMASGSFQKSSKDCINIAQPTVSKVFSSFLDSMLKHTGRYIKMPETDMLVGEKQKFYDRANFPGIIGCIDGTHIPLIAPKESEFAFVNRKGFHSLNVQVSYYLR